MKNLIIAIAVAGMTQAGASVAFAQSDAGMHKDGAPTSAGTTDAQAKDLRGHSETPTTGSGASGMEMKGGSSEMKPAAGSMEPTGNMKADQNQSTPNSSMQK